MPVSLVLLFSNVAQPTEMQQQARPAAKIHKDNTYNS
jgi:hypothetical protein